MRKSSLSHEIPMSLFSYERLVHVRFIKEAVKKLFHAEEDCSFLNNCKSCPFYRCAARLIIRNFIRLLLTSVVNVLSLKEMHPWLVSRNNCCEKHDKVMDIY